jgi:dolichol-phosphate mannosyltransferase
MAEVPTTWRDRSAGASRFDLRAWLPKYLRWYVHALPARGRRAS